MRDRECTDVCFLAVFIAFLGSMIYLTFLGYSAGELPKLLAPVDGDFNLCGWKNATEGNVYNNMDYPKLLITDWSDPSLGAMFLSSVCVKECPKTAKLTVDFVPTQQVPELEQAGGEDWEVNSYSVMKICLPLAPPPTVQAGIDAIKAMIMQGPSGTYLEDMRRASRSIYLSIAMSIIYSIAFIYFLSIFGETIAWICVVVLQLALIGATVALYFMWDQQKQLNSAMDANTDVEAMKEAQ